MPVQFNSSILGLQVQLPFNASTGLHTQMYPKVNLPVYLHASLSSNHKDLPVTLTTCVPAHKCTHSSPYLFIFSYFHSDKPLRSTRPRFYMSTYVPVHHYTPFDFFIFFFGITCTITFQLIYWPTDPPESKFTCLPSCFSFA